MWDDVIIGNGEHFCTAVICFKGEDTDVNISENRNSYWISHLILDGGMKIFKDTLEGEKLGEMLEKVKTEGELEYQISDFLNRLFLRNVDPIRILEIVRIKMEEAYDSGRRAKADELRRVLGIYH